MTDVSTNEGSVPFPETSEPKRRGDHRGGKLLSWGLLLALTVPLLTGLRNAGVPGSLLIGSLAGGIFLAMWRGPLRVPNIPYDLSQGLMACFIAHSITPATVNEFARHYPIFLVAVVSTIGMATLSGMWLARRGTIAAQSAIFGSFPGAAPAMVLIAADSGADPRMVAVMQYARIVIVALTTAVAGFFYLSSSPRPASIVISVAFSSWDIVATISFAAVTSFVGHRSGISAGTLLIPLGLASLLSATGLYVFALPYWLITPCFVLVGWSIGLQFDSASFRTALRSLPNIFLGIILLIGGCFLVAVALSAVTDMDLMTAYLATSPGGLDAAVIIASSAHADTAFVTCLQITRLIFVLVLGPPIAKRIVRWVAGVEVKIK